MTSQQQHAIMTAVSGLWLNLLSCLPGVLTLNIFFNICDPIGIIKTKNNKTKCLEQDLNLRPLEWQAVLETPYHATPPQKKNTKLFGLILKIRKGKIAFERLSVDCETCFLGTT